MAKAKTTSNDAGPQETSYQWSPFATPSHAASIGWQPSEEPAEKPLSLVQVESESPRSSRENKGRKRPRPLSSSPPSDSKTTSDADPIICQGLAKTETLESACSAEKKNPQPGPKKYGPRYEGTASDGLPKGITQTWNGATAVLTFSRDVHLCLVGRARLDIIRGEIDVLGYHLDATDSCRKTVSMESPTWRSVVTLVPTTKQETILQVHSVSGNTKETSTFRICDPSDTRIRPTVVPNTWKMAMDAIVPNLSSGDYTQSETDKHGYRDIYGKSLSQPENGDPLHISKARVVVCGAKGVGKSTCMRYVAHRLLSCSNYKAVALLDCDAGQPELSPPGMLTLTVVSSPLLHPPHVHMVTGSLDSSAAVASRHVEAYYFGHVSSKADPSLYMELISKLISRYENLVGEEYEADESKLPLLVNTDGWVKGMGYQLLLSLLDLIQPRHVLQLLGENKSKIFDLSHASSQSTVLHVVHAYNNSTANLSTRAVTSTSRVSSVASLTSMDGNLEDASNTSSGLVTPTNSSSVPSLALRSLRLCSYFLGGADIFWESEDLFFGCQGIVDQNCRIACRLAEAKPYVVPMDAVSYGVFRGSDTGRDFQNDDATVLDALNGSIVGLCRSRDAEGGSESMEQLSCRSCVGLGIIRSIDRIRRLFFILSPVCKDDLQSVSVLVGGSVQLPSTMTDRGCYSDAFPYLCCDGISIGIGAEFMRSRNSLLRKSVSM